MPVIAMTREMGSLGKDVAAALAEKLGVTLVHHEIIDVLADKMRVRKSHVTRLLEGQASLLERLTADKTSLSIFTAAEICALAMKEGGAVFRGWGAAHVLRGIPHVACVRVCAPFELRTRRMMERLKTDDVARVEEEIRNSDEAQTAVIRRNFQVDWTDAMHYDLVLNTEKVSTARCVDEILGLVRSPEFAETEASRQALADLALQTRARAALRTDPSTRSLRISVTADQGRLTLAGVVDKSEERGRAESIAGAVQGAVEVVNSLRAGSEMRARFS